MEENQQVEPLNQPEVEAGVQENTNASASKPRKRMKFLLLLLASSLLLIMVLVAFMFIKGGSPPIANVNIEQIKEQVTSEKADAARKISEYLYTQKRPDGYNNLIAHFDELCLGANAQKCPYGDKNVFEINNSWSALGFFSSYQLTKSQSDLAQSRADVEKLEEYCAVNMEECLWVLMQIELIALDSGSTELDFIRRAADLLLTNSNEVNVMLLSIESRELALAYQLLKDERYLAESKERYAQAKSDFEEGVGSEVPSRDTNPLQACWVTLAAAELARATRDPFFINEAAQVHTSEYIRIKKYENPFAVNIQPCIETHYIVHSLTGDSTYYEEGLRLLRFMEENFHDTAEKRITWGEGGIVSANPKSIGVEQFVKQVNVTDTSYMLYLLYLFSPK